MWIFNFSITTLVEEVFLARKTLLGFHIGLQILVKNHLTICVIPQTTNAREGLETKQLSCTVGGNVNWYSHYGEQYGGSLEN